MEPKSPSATRGNSLGTPPFWVPCGCGSKICTKNGLGTCNCKQGLKPVVVLILTHTHVTLQMSLLFGAIRGAVFNPYLSWDLLVLRPALSQEVSCVQGSSLKKLSKMVWCLLVCPHPKNKYLPFCWFGCGRKPCWVKMRKSIRVQVTKAGKSRPSFGALQVTSCLSLIHDVPGGVHIFCLLTTLFAG